MPAEAEDNVLAVDGISEEVYRSASGLNKSLLCEFMRSPKHYLSAVKNPIKPTKSMQLGTVLHQLVLRPYETPCFAVMKKVDRRKTADKEYAANFEAENAGKIIIDAEDEVIVRSMRESLMKNARFAKIMERTSHREFGIFADRKCSDGVVRLKGMLDGYCERDGTVFDIKTTEDASPEKFRKYFRNFKYDIQQVQYTYLLTATKLGFSNFQFVAVENCEPFEVSFHTLSMEQYMRSFDKWKRSLDFFSACASKEDFNIGYTSETNEITL